MNKDKFRVSEDDIRTKVVYDWLVGHSFGPEEISIEFSFELKLGRGIFRVDGASETTSRKDATYRPRADILVRTHDGKNLMIVEVKAPGEVLNNEARDQGISYARLLRKGGMAPFVVLTNGKDTKFFDSFSGEQINGTCIPRNHPYVKTGYVVTGNDLTLRSQFLESFISLNPENLLAFCAAQVEFRMQRLCDDDRFSGKKYIRSLYVDREQAKKQLIRQLDEEKKTIILVTGFPQVGKTNFICNTIEQRLKAGHPCLFFPAIRMGVGLLHEIAEDFEWELGDSSPLYQLIHYKLSSILQKLSQRLTIFIDGLNEPELSLVRAIDKDCERLSSEQGISFVVSFINTAAPRLLKDDANNISYMADCASINTEAIDLITTSPENLINKANLVVLDKYSEEEREAIYKKYSEIYQVQVPVNHQKIDDPFLIRIGMQEYAGKQLPEQLDEPTLLEKFIIAKAKRLNLGPNFSHKRITSLVYQTGGEMFLKDAPLSWSDTLTLWNLPDIPDKLFDLALFAQVSKNGVEPAINFYNERERDFVIAYHSQNWDVRLKTFEIILSEFSIAIKTLTGQGALRWFLDNNIPGLKLCAENYKLFQDPSLRRMILTALWRNYNKLSEQDYVWVETAMGEGLIDSDLRVRVEAVKLLAVYSEDEEKLQEVLSKEPSLMRSILEIEERYPVESNVGSIIIKAFLNLHCFETFGDEDSSSITDLLIELQQDPKSPINYAAIKLLGAISPNVFLQKLRDLIINKRLSETGRLYKVYAIGLALASGQLGEYYYGDPMCPSYLYDNLYDEPQELHKEYRKMYKLCKEVLEFFLKEKGAIELCELLDNLNPQHIRNSDTSTIINHRAYFETRRNQLPLPFADSD